MLKVMKKKLLVVIAMLVVASGIIFTGSTSTEAKSNKVQYLGKYKLTAYCGCKKCSGKWGARTASGKKAKQGRTIAVDKRKIKLGSKVQINGKTRAVIKISAEATKEEAIAAGKEAIADKLTGNIVKEIYVPKKIINIVMK